MANIAKWSIVAIAAYFLAIRTYSWHAWVTNCRPTAAARAGRLTGGLFEIWAIVAICVWWQP